MAPPVSARRSCRGDPAVSDRKRDARGVGLVRDDRALGQHRADRLADLLGRQRTCGTCGSRGLGKLRSLVGVERLSETLEAADSVLGRRGQLVDLAAVGYEVALLAGIREERHRRLGVEKHEVLEAGELNRGKLGQVRQPVERRQASPALEAGGECLAQELCARRSRNSAGSQETPLAQRPAAQQDRGPSGGGAQHTGNPLDDFARRHLGRRERRRE